MSNNAIVSRQNLKNVYKKLWKREVTRYNLCSLHKLASRVDYGGQHAGEANHAM